LLKPILRHLAMGNAYGRFRNEPAEPCGYLFYVVNPVVDEVDLPFAVDLPENDLPYEALVLLHYIRPYRKPILRRGFH